VLLKYRCIHAKNFTAACFPTFFTQRIINLRGVRKAVIKNGSQKRPRSQKTRWQKNDEETSKEVEKEVKPTSFYFFVVNFVNEWV